MANFENFVKSMTLCLLKFKVTPIFCLPSNVIPGEVTASSKYLLSCKAADLFEEGLPLKCILPVFSAMPQYCKLHGRVHLKILPPSKKSAVPKAELVEVLRCSAFTSVMRSKIPAKIMVYNTPTNEIHKTIQVGTKMISQGQLIILEKNK